MENLKVYYKHYRYLEFDFKRNELGKQVLINHKISPMRYIKSGKNKARWEPSSQGGKTECVAEYNYGGNVFSITATAVCNPTDRFCYKNGRDLAYFRLTQLLGHIKAMENIIKEEV